MFDALQMDDLAEALGADGIGAFIVTLRADLHAVARGLSSAVQADDAAAIAREAHVLVALAGLVGAEALSEAARATQRFARAGEGAYRSRAQDLAARAVRLAARLPADPAER